MSRTTEPQDSAKAEGADSPADDTCVVCFKDVDIYSIGECDHPVCYECSTRMRVLCQQNECPICRQVLSKVIFTNAILPYRELEAKNRSEYYNIKYKIRFCTLQIQQEFFSLMDHPCPKCNTAPYHTFQGLKNHVRKEHDLHYCDLCTEHLKIFTFERRCYTQAELGLHRTKGDADNRSHRGHPLCEYCNKRYLDRDELFRHLRIDHYFCHFCDADGFNEFYKDYDALAEHFRQDHFLCEEGKCAADQFVGAFRTEIDFKAHIAKEHGHLLNKQQAKQTRTLQLEITLGPRGRSGQNDQGIANMRGRGSGDTTHDEYEEAMNSYAAQQNHRSITIDACNEQDFPSLRGAATGPSVSLVRPPPQSMLNRSATAGLARTKENFPALGGGGGGGGNGPQWRQPQKAQPASSAARKPPAASTGAIPRTSNAAGSNGNGSSMFIHVSNRPQTSNQNGGNSKGSSVSEFPELPRGSGKSKKQTRLLEEDMGTTSAHVPMANVSAKHRTLVDDYVSIAKPSNFQKIQMVQKDEMEAKARKAAEKLNAPKLTTEDFPTLGGGGGAVASNFTSNKPPTTPNMSSAQWIKSLSEKKQRELENRKAKVAPAPLLNKDNRTNNNKLANSSSATSVPEQTTKKDKKLKDKEKDKEKRNVTESKSTTKVNGKAKEKNNNENMSSNANLNGVSPQASPVRSGKGSPTAPTGPAARPPPGFRGDQPTSMKPPPGFHSNVTVNSVAKSPNSLTFTSSLGESYSIVPTHSYVQPPEATARNLKLVGCFKESLPSPEGLEEFRQISQNFREGIFKTQAYYEHCQAALGSKFDSTFPELLALLPDISKQQELYLVHAQRLNTLPAHQRKSLPKLEVCSTCKQVLLLSDLDNHRKFHSANKNFPELSGRR